MPRKYLYHCNPAASEFKIALTEGVHRAITAAIETASQYQIDVETVTAQSPELNQLLDAIEGMQAPGKSSYQVQLEVEIAARPFLAARRRMRKEARGK
jgi:hypothetical protein